MATSVKITAVGDAVGVVLPKEILAALKVGQGDTLFLTETPDGFLLTPYNERFAKQLEAAEGFMRKYRDMLRELAK